MERTRTGVEPTALGTLPAEDLFELGNNYVMDRALCRLELEAAETESAESASHLQPKAKSQSLGFILLFFCLTTSL